MVFALYASIFVSPALREKRKGNGTANVKHHGNGAPPGLFIAIKKPKFRNDVSALTIRHHEENQVLL